MDDIERDIDDLESSIVTKPNQLHRSQDQWSHGQRLNDQRSHDQRSHDQRSLDQRYPDYRSEDQWPHGKNSNPDERDPKRTVTARDPGSKNSSDFGGSKKPDLGSSPESGSKWMRDTPDLLCGATG